MREHRDFLIHSSTSMQNFSAMVLTMAGGNTLSLGFSPIFSNSLRNGLHQFINTFTLTPAASASCCFDIAFICFQVCRYITITLQGYNYKFAGTNLIVCRDITQSLLGGQGGQYIWGKSHAYRIRGRYAGEFSRFRCPPCPPARRRAVRRKPGYGGSPQSHPLYKARHDSRDARGSDGA